MFLTLALTGLRRSELERLRWGHVNLLEGTLRVVESKSEEGERLIALPPTLLRELTGAPARMVDRERHLVSVAGWGARLLAAQDIKGLVRWSQGLYAPPSQFVDW